MDAWTASVSVLVISILSTNTGDSPLGCANIPLNSTAQQYAQVFVSYVERHPNQMHELFDVVASYALIDVWPCP